MYSLFISDLHLSHPSTPEWRLFDHLIQLIKQEPIDALYILGDLVEFWIGDDDPSDEAKRLAMQLKDITRVCPVYYLHGNRDFLMGNHFFQASGVCALANEAVISLYGERILLLHGDELCTDDIAYQRFRRLVRSSPLRYFFSMLPLRLRKAIAQSIRSKTQTSTMKKSVTVLDVAADAVTHYLNKHAVSTMIHGHTHKPNIHSSRNATHNDQTRIVLGDWHSTAKIIVWKKSGDYKLMSLSEDTASFID